MMNNILLLMLVAIWGFGCATDPHSAIHKNNVHTVSVEPTVQAPAMRYMEKNSAGGLNGVLVSAIMDGLYAEEIKRMEIAMQTNHIDVPEMVRSNFVQTLQEHGYNFTGRSGEATFVVQIVQFGYDLRSGFSNVKVPLLILSAQLVKPDGKVIWRGQSQTKNALLFGRAGLAFDERRKGMGEKDWEKYAADSTRLREDWERVAKIAVEDLFQAEKKPEANSARLAERQ